MRILCLPDVHCHPDYANTRLDWANDVIRSERPTHIVCLGDFADMPSLASYDRGRLAFEGRRFKHDLDAAADGMRRLLKGVKGPKLTMLLGNHEDRVDRLASERPELAGFVGARSMTHLRAWRVHPYRAIFTLGGIHFTHNTFSANGNPVGAQALGSAVLRNEMVSIVVGHSHLLDLCVRTTAAGRKVMGLSAGCLVHPRYGEQQWAIGASRRWWSGLTILSDVRDGWPADIRFMEHT